MWVCTRTSSALERGAAGEAGPLPVSPQELSREDRDPYPSWSGPRSRGAPGGRPHPPHWSKAPSLGLSRPCSSWALRPRDGLPLPEPASSWGGDAAQPVTAFSVRRGPGGPHRGPARRRSSGPWGGAHASGGAVSHRAAGWGSSGGTLRFYVIPKEAVLLDSSPRPGWCGKGRSQEGLGARRWPERSGPRGASSGLGIPPSPALADTSAGGKRPVHTWALSSLAFGKST